MIDIEYANAYSEVLEILRYISIDDYNKIPKNKIEVFEHNSNKNYLFEYDPDKTLEEQNVSKRAKAIIGLLFRDYWATQNQKETIIARQSYDREKIEEEKRKKYSPDTIFKNNCQESNLKKDSIESVAMIEYKESFFKKIINKIWRIFKRG